MSLYTTPTFIELLQAWWLQNLSGQTELNCVLDDGSSKNTSTNNMSCELLKIIMSDQSKYLREKA